MSGLARRIGVCLLASALGCGSVLAQGWQHIGKVQRVEKLNDGVELAAGSTKVRITAFRQGVFRVRVAPKGAFPKDFSWAMMESPAPPTVKIEENEKEVRVTSGSLVAVVQRSPLLINFFDAAGNVLLADEPSLPMAWDGQRAHVWKKMPADENYYGLGDKAGPMNRRNRAFTNWNIDAYGWQESTDPLYKTIPFYVALRKGRAHGIFVDSTWRTAFDFGKEGREFSSFGSEGGDLDYYFIDGPEPRAVVQRYAELTEFLAGRRLRLPRAPDSHEPPEEPLSGEGELPK